MSLHDDIVKLTQEVGLAVEEVRLNIKEIRNRIKITHGFDLLVGDTPYHHYKSLFEALDNVKPFGRIRVDSNQEISEPLIVDKHHVTVELLRGVQLTNIKNFDHLIEVRKSGFSLLNARIDGFTTVIHFPSQLSVCYLQNSLFNGLNFFSGKEPVNFDDTGSYKAGVI